MTWQQWALAIALGIWGPVYLAVLVAVLFTLAKRAAGWDPD